MYVAQWRATTRHHAPVLSRLTFETCPVGRQAFIALAGLLNAKGLSEERLGSAIAILAGAVAVRLMDEGWQPETLPGETPAFLKDSRRFEPFAVIADLVEGTVTPEEWTRRCRNINLSGPLCLTGGDGSASVANPLDLNAAAPQPATRSSRRRRQW